MTTEYVFKGPNMTWKIKFLGECCRRGLYRRITAENVTYKQMERYASGAITMQLCLSTRAPLGYSAKRAPLGGKGKGGGA